MQVDFVYQLLLSHLFHLSQCQPYCLGKQRGNGITYCNALILLAAIETERVGEGLKAGKLAQSEDTWTLGMDVTVSIRIGDSIGRTVPIQAAKRSIILLTIVPARL